ncbi:hypothetical protein DLAC_04507 [Tieghemostelium lacteum]|uniref:Uncharacterized protein n=1 Tax=Tieghemostelium lacteum TaxID=361077 RepID=A0A151ZJQ9_TIELA|nr:hypothetical protein DLAC_04507 [Tieghemostelium lacteum]|eukprot:KYQ94213.1 hypothetical protein DLAC_04507 [Tieghemostelium lacteum]
MHPSVTLPHYILKNILEYIVNQCTETEYVLGFLKKYTLISKEWNSKIIPSLVMTRDLVQPHVHSPRPSYVNFLIELLKLSDKMNWDFCNLHYSEKYKGLPSTMNPRISSVDIGQQLELIPIFYNRFPNLRQMKFQNMKEELSDLHNMLVKFETERESKNLKPIELHLHYQGYISYYNGFQRYESIPLDIIFGNTDFYKVTFDSIMLVQSNHFPPTLPYTPNRIVEINLDIVKIDKPLLDTIIDLSSHCKKFSIRDLIIIPNVSFDTVLEKLAKSNMVLESLSVSTPEEVTIQTLIAFINHINTKELSLLFDIVKVENEEFIHKAIITNNTIKSIGYMLLGGLNGYNFNLYDKWQNRDKLENISIQNSMDNVHEYAHEMVSMKSVVLGQGYNRQGIDKLLRMNLPNLTNFEFTQSKHIRFPVETLVENRYIQSITCYNGILLNEFLLIINSKEMVSLSKLDVLNISFSNQIQNQNDMISFIHAIRMNNKLTHLTIVGDSLFRNDEIYNNYKIYLEILFHNKTLQKFILPGQNFPKLIRWHLIKFEKMLKANNTILHLRLLPSNNYHLDSKHETDLFNLFDFVMSNQIILPHYLIKNILLYLLNQSTEIEYIYSFIKKFTLVSKEWNIKIIPVLQLSREVVPIRSFSPRPSYVDILEKLIRLSKRSGWNFTLPYSDNAGDLSKLDIKVSSHVSSLSVSIASPPFFSLPSIIKKFPRIKTVHLYTTSMVYINSSYIQIIKKCNENRQLQNLEPIQFELNLEPTLAIYKPLQTLDIIFGCQNFQKVSIYSIILSESINPMQFLDYSPNGIVELVLSHIKVDKWLLDLIINLSPQCKVLVIKEIILNPRDTRFDGVLEKIEESPNVFESLTISTKEHVSYETLISFLNNVKTSEISLIIDRIELDVQDDFFVSTICNSYVKSIGYMVLGGLGGSFFNLYNIWNNRVNLEQVTLQVAMDQINLHANELISLKKLVLGNGYNQLGIESLLQMNIPNLTELEFSQTKHHRIPFIALLSNMNLQSITCSSDIYMSELILILKSNHLVNLRKIEAKNIDFTNEIRSYDDLTLLIVAIKYNTNITHLSLSGTPFVIPKIMNYDMYQFYLDILFTNLTLQKLSLPNQYKPLTERHYQQFKTMLSINHTILHINLYPSEYIPVVNSKDTELKLFNLFGIYNVNIIKSTLE